MKKQKIRTEEELSLEEMVRNPLVISFVHKTRLEHLDTDNNFSNEGEFKIDPDNGYVLFGLYGSNEEESLIIYHRQRTKGRELEEWMDVNLTSNLHEAKDRMDEFIEDLKVKSVLDHSLKEKFSRYRRFEADFPTQDESIGYVYEGIPVTPQNLADLADAINSVMH